MKTRRTSASETRPSKLPVSRILRYALGCTLAAAAGTALAADETGKWYINPMYGWTKTDPAHGVEDDDHWGVGIGKHLSDVWSVELNGLFGSFDGAPNVTLDQESYSIDALVVANRAGRGSPYLTFGAGYIKHDYGAVSFDGALAQIGVGLMIDVAENSSRSFVFQLRPEIKARYDWADYPNHDDEHDYIAQIGFAFNFGPARAQPVAAAIAAPAAAAAALPPPPPPRPNNDLDGDGVTNDGDLCPNTPRGTQVNPVGCTRSDPITLRGVNFDNDSATLTPASGTLLDQVALDLKRHPQLKVELRGYTDNVGSAAYNMQLSQRRADAVREYLISKGATDAQVTAKGYGEADPVQSNNTPMGRLENRRVVMSVLENPNDVEVKGEPK